MIAVGKEGITTAAPPEGGVPTASAGGGTSGPKTWSVTRRAIASEDACRRVRWAGKWPAEWPAEWAQWVQRAGG